MWVAPARYFNPKKKKKRKLDSIPKIIYPCVCVCVCVERVRGGSSQVPYNTADWCAPIAVGGPTSIFEG